MPEFVPIKGFKMLEDALKAKAASNSLIYLYFYGEKDKDGKSWCSDCVAAEPTVNRAFREYAHPDSLIYTVDVGNRESWKNMNNQFRLPPYSLNVIPSILRWKGVERLEGDQMLKLTLLELFFEEANMESDLPSKQD